MANLKIKLHGVGICYKKGVHWNVLFPFNHDHQVFLKALGMSGSLAAPGRVIEIFEKSGSTSPSGGLNHLLDLTEQPAGSNPGLHIHGIRPKRDWQDHAVLLRVRGGVLHQTDQMKSKYLLTKNGVDHRPAKNFGYSAEITLPGSEFFISLNPLGLSIPIPLISDIEFNNACPTCPPDDNADFSMVYNVIHDAANPATEFELKRDPGDAPPKNFGAGFFDEFRKGDIEFKPDTNDPAPGIAGLPCNLVGASDSTDLP
jgi:hypothetical protein